MDLKKQLATFFETQQMIHDYFDYTENLVPLPLEDKTEYYWDIRDYDVRFHEEPLTEAILEDGKNFAANIYMLRCLPSQVYSTDEYTMVCVDTIPDRKKCLMIFDNTKKIEGLEEYDYLY